MKISDRIRLIEALAGPLIIAGGLIAAIAVPRVSDISLATISGGFAYMVRSMGRGDGDDITINRYPIAGAPDDAIGVRLDRTPENAIVSSDVYVGEPRIPEVNDRFNQTPFVGANKLGVAEEDLDENP